MKIRIKFIIILFTIIICNSTGFAQQTPSSGYQCVGGVYYTYEDFLSGNITDLGILQTNLTNRLNGGDIKEIHFMKPDPTMTIGPQDYKFKLKENKIWGFRKNDGSTYRIDIVEHKIYNLISTGSYYLWADPSTFVGRDEKGLVNWVQIVYQLGSSGEGFSKHLFISKEGNGKLYSCNNKNLKELFKDDPEILAEIDANPIKEKEEKKLQASINNVIKWVEKYNAKHKK